MAFAFNPITGKLDLVGTGGGSATTDASLLTSGTLALARLDPLVSLDNINNNFTAGQTITAPANTSALTASYSVTGANTTPLLDLSGTWNTTGSANGIRLNINNVASSSGSNLLNLQLGGIPLFTVTRSGSVTTAGAFFAGNSASGLLGLTGMGSGITYTSQNTGHFPVAGGIIEQRSGTTAQTLRLYGTFTDASNFERGFMRWNNNVLEIGTEAGGTGTARQFALNINGVTIAATSNNDFDVRNNLTFKSRQAAITASAFGKILLTDAGNSVSGSPYLLFGGTSAAFPSLKRSSTTLQVRLANDSDFTAVQGKITTETAYTASPITPTGFLTIYDSTGTAYKVACSL